MGDWASEAREGAQMRNLNCKGSTAVGEKKSRKYCGEIGVIRKETVGIKNMKFHARKEELFSQGVVTSPKAEKDSQILY